MMRDEKKTKKQLIHELRDLRDVVVRLRALESECSLTADALRREKDRAEIYLYIAGVILVVLEAGQRVSLVNRKGCEILGYTREEIVGKNWFDVFVPAWDRDRVKAGFVKLIAGEIEPAEYFENPVLSRNGEERIIAWHNTVLRNEEGRIIATLSSGEDITERKRAIEALRVAHEELERRVEERTAELVKTNEQLKQEIREREQAEEALRNSERRLADIISFLPNATFVIDREGRVIAWNRAMEEMTGVKARVILGKGGHEYAVPFFGERQSMLIDRVLEASHAHENQYALFEREDDTVVAERYLPSFRGGTYFWAKAGPLYDSHGHVVGAIESLRDITKLKQAEHALRESEKRYRNIFELAVEGIFQATEDGHYLSVNPAFARICGFSSPEEMVKEVTDIARQLYVNPEDRTKIKALYEYPGFVKGFETQFRRKDGGVIWVSITARSVRDEDGKLLRYEGTIEDITERKQAERLLLQREKLNTLGAIAAEVAHEIRNPLVAIGGFARRLRENFPDSRECDIILNESRRLERVLTRIRNYLKPVEIRPQVCSVTRLVTGCLALLAPETERRRIMCRLDSKLSLPNVYADPDILTQIFINLILNAAEAMDKGGTLVIRFFATDTDLSIQFKNKAERHKIKPPELLFRPFAEGGESIGLPLCYQLLRDMGGLLSFTQERDHMIFTVTLPRASRQGVAVDKVEIG
jgi:PAS domain S-box-containing protein